MPEPYWPKRKNAFTLRDAHAINNLVRVTCRYCKITRVYMPDELRQALGNIEVDDVRYQMRCSKCRERHTLETKCITPSAEERQTITVRRIDRIDYVRRITWRDVVGG